MILGAAAAATAGIPAPGLTQSFAQIPDRNSVSNDQTAAAADGEFRQQRGVLLGKTASEPERIEAARRLLSQREDDVLSQALGSGEASQIIAVAEALADVENPPTQFIADLGRQLGANVSRDVADAVARALVNYKDNDIAKRLLWDFVRRANAPEKARVAAIRTMGSLTDKDSAAVLVEDLLRPDQATAINEAATDALTRMTGLSEYGNDVALWDQWWQRQQGKSPEQFRNERFQERTVEGLRAQEHLTQLAETIGTYVDDMHRQLTTEAQREQHVLMCLKNPQPEFRRAGANLVIQKKQNGETITPPIVEQLRALVGDSSADVRRLAAQAIEKINDPGAVKPILAQLQRERIPSVKAALIDAVAPTQDLAAVPELLTQLKDPSMQVAKSAARALGAMGGEISKNADLATLTAESLADALSRTAGARGAQELREWVVIALVPLKNSGMMKDLFKLLPQRLDNTPKVRMNAVRALANLNVNAALKQDIAQQLVGVLGGDTEAGVRLEAAQALGQIGGPAQAEALYASMDARKETDAKVRQEAWKSLSGLFQKPEFDVQSLFFWTNQRFHGEFEKQLAVYLALDKKLKLAPPNSKAMDELNSGRSIIGALYLEDAIAKPEDAIPYLKDALGYYDSQPKSDKSVTEVQGNLMKAYLRAKQYKAAIQFADDRIKVDPANQTDMGREIQAEVRRLQEAKQWESALALLDETTHSEQFKGTNREKFDQQRRDIQDRKPSLQDFLREYYAERRFTPSYT
jgi:HEAT repeat protein